MVRNALYWIGVTFGLTALVLLELWGFLMGWLMVGLLIYILLGGSLG